ncbi:MAG TPA: hypothetical protein VLG48_01480, partial [Candidatus Methylomirabilis sp.]|nr:hypothetical protein [Candidatus Methylomirabilis sp.]
MRKEAVGVRDTQAGRGGAQEFSLPADLHGMGAVSSPPGLRLGAWTPWLIALLAAALYLGTLRYRFVWDDLALIALNQFVRRLADLPNWLTM